jgi:hypothetical protein
VTLELAQDTIEQWQELGIVSGSLVATATLIGIVVRWVVLPVWRTIQRLNEVADQLLGDKKRNIPSLTDRMSTLEKGQAELARRLAHLERGPLAPGGEA